MMTATVITVAETTLGSNGRNLLDAGLVNVPNHDADDGTKQKGIPLDLHIHRPTLAPTPKLNRKPARFSRNKTIAEANTIPAA